MRDWTEEERAKQGELIKTWKPWKQSTGAKTKTGKKASSQNAYLHGLYSAPMKKILQEFSNQLKAKGYKQKNL